jgi:heptosyltransferase-2
VERIEVDEQVLFHSGKAGQAKALLGLWQRLAGRSYDLCAVLQYDRRYSLLVKPVRARRKVKLGPANRMGLVEGRWHANEYARILGLGPDSYHENDVELLRPAEVPMTGPAEEIWANQERGKDESPLHHGWYSRVALVPAGAKNVLREGALRRWPLQNYVALAKSLLARGYEVVLTGSKEDAWVREAFGELLNSNATSTKSAVRDCIGRTTLPELLALYDACDAVVTHDTGSLHVAAISRAQVLAIFGPTAMGNFLPRRAGVRGIWGGERLPCRPCYDGRDFAPCPRNVCMEDVTVERVLHELEEMLGLKRE